MAQSVARIIAIDLGTAYTRVGFFNGEKFRLFHDEQGKTDIPSYVAFTKSRVLVGDEALNHAENDPINTVFDIIRLIGKQFFDPALQADMKLWPFNVVQGHENKAMVAVQWKGTAHQFSPEEICSLILLRMKQIAEFHLESAVVTSAVITVPVNFNHFQRQAIKEAAFIASLDVKALISPPPAAAAMLYNFHAMPRYSNSFNWNPFSSGPAEKNILVFDLGAGTLDVSVVNIKEGKCVVRATTGDDHLGGEDFDKLLMNNLIDCVLTVKHKQIISSNKMAMRRLRQACEQAKEVLSQTANYELLISPLYEKVDFQTTISKGMFKMLTEGLVDKCIETIIACIEESGINKRAISTVIPAGGAVTNIPRLEYLIRKYFDNKDLYIEKNVEGAVTYGAAIQAFLLSGQKSYRIQSISLIDASTLSFGMPSRLGGEMCVMIPKNSTLPYLNKKRMHINHYAWNKTLAVYEGKGCFFRENNLVSTLPISRCPVPRICEFVISFEMDSSGILTVKAIDGMCATEHRAIIGNINHSLPSLECSRNKIWDAFSHQEEEKMPSSFNVTTSRECYNPSSKKEIGQGSKQLTQPSKPAIGIDLGTTCSCVGVWRHGRVEIIANEYGKRTSLSCVAFTEAGRLIGDAAISQLTMNPTNTITNVKRLIGRHNLGQNVQNCINTLPFEVKEGPNGRPAIIVQYNGEQKLFAPEEMTAMMLRRIKEQAEEHTKTEVRDAVITVPSSFSDSQRKATRDAGLIAGLNILQLLNEPTSAAITYYLHKTSLGSFDKKNVLVFDLGGGTFDVSVLTVSNGKIQVLAVHGDSNLGGEDFDTILVNHFVEQFNTKVVPEKKSIRNNPRSLRRLRAACEKAKRVLSTVPKTNIDLDALYEGIDLNVSITKVEFEALTVDLISRCMEHVKRCLENAKMDKSNIGDVVLVGGSTRIPVLQQALQEFFNGKELCKSINQDEGVAYGATILAAKLSKKDDKRFSGLEIHDVTSLSIGIETGGGSMHLLVPKYSKIPMLEKRLVFYTTEDNVSEIPITLFEGVSEKKSFVLSDIPHQSRGSAEISVDLIIDSSGILNLAYNAVTSQSSEIVVKELGSPNLTGEEIKKMINDADKFKADDDDQKQRAEAMNALENIAFGKLKEMASSSIFEDSKKKEMEKAANMLLHWLETHQNAKIEEINTMKQQFESLFD